MYLVTVLPQTIMAIKSLFVQKPYLRKNYIEANLEEDID